MIAAELIYASYAVINVRELVDGSSLKEKKGYFDYTNDAVSYLNKTDDEFYRIEKSYFSVQLRDALMQNYKGTTACNSLNNPSTTEFYHHLKIPFLFGVVCNISGFDSRQNIQTLAGVKYFLTKTGYAIPFGYEYVTTFGDVHIFRNKYYLPLGFSYDTYITFDKFNSLTSYKKDEVLLKAFVTDNKSLTLKDFSEISEENLNNYLFPIQVPVMVQDKDIILNGAPVELYKNISPDRTVPASLPQFSNQLNSSADQYAIQESAKTQLSLILTSNKDTEGKLSWRKRNESFNDVNSTIFKIKKDWWKYYFGELYGSDNFWGGAYRNAYDLNVNFSQLDGLTLEVPGAGGKITLKKYEIFAKLPQDMASYVKDIKKLRENTLQIRQYSNDYIAGDIMLDKNKLLFLSIPYDKGWHVKVDGKAANIEKVNIGFMGIFLNKGFHTVELQYTPPFLIAGMAVSLLSLIIFVATIIISLKRSIKADGVNVRI